MRICKTCGKSKPIEEFYERHDRRKLNWRKECKACMRAKPVRSWKDLSLATRQARYLVVLAYRRYNKETVALWARTGAPKRLLRKLGISEEQISIILSRRNGPCDICGKLETITRNGRVRPLCIDHDHNTLQFRGLLCSYCNVAIGYVGESIEILQKMQTYLLRTSI
jgi:hypothetical protein